MVNKNFWRKVLKATVSFLPIFLLFHASVCPAQQKTEIISSTFNIFQQTGACFAVISHGSAMVFGSRDGAAVFRRMRSSINGDGVWSIRNGLVLLIEDPATVRKAVELVQPEIVLGQREKELDQQLSRGDMDSAKFAGLKRENEGQQLALALRIFNQMGALTSESFESGKARRLY